jgi:hypothetical protein
MTDSGEFMRPAGQPAGMQAKRAAADSARRAWSKPAVRLFSLQRTLAGSGGFFDAPINGAPSPS